MGVEQKLPIYHKPDWHRALSDLLGDFVGQEGYITEVGTVRLLGPLHTNPDHSIFLSKSTISGPTKVLTAVSSLGFAGF